MGGRLICCHACVAGLATGDGAHSAIMLRHMTRLTHRPDANANTLKFSDALARSDVRHESKFFASLCRLALPRTGGCQRAVGTQHRRLANGLPALRTVRRAVRLPIQIMAAQCMSTHLSEHDCCSTQATIACAA